MNRRSFLTTFFGGTFAITTLDLEKLLWIPNQKKIFIPPAGAILSPKIYRLIRRRIDLSEATFREQGAPFGYRDLGSVTRGGTCLYFQFEKLWNIRE